MDASEDQPQTSNCVLYECVPPEIIQRFDDYLAFEDSCNFQQSSQYVESVLVRRWQGYDKIQISDDASDCYLQCSSGRLPKRSFAEENLFNILTKCDQITQVVIVIKEMGDLQGHFDVKQNRLLRETSPYHQGGYLGNFLSRAPCNLISRLKSLSLHVDIMRESFRELWFPCPIQDLRYCIDKLVDATFETFIQISFCSASIHLKDYEVRNFLMSGMEMALKEMAEKHAKTDFSIDANEGYVDMTVEKGNVEYSFAFFYYNPQICEPPSNERESLELFEQHEIGKNVFDFLSVEPLDVTNSSPPLQNFFILS
uniref:Uncharacterized protein n=1 Tax=Parascaris univalens TaxID=6257 RepID=A0A915ADI8_PARUN